MITFAVLYVAGVIALAPVLEHVVFSSRQPWMILGLLAALVTLLLIASTLAGIIASQIVNPLSQLRQDVRRSMVAEENGRRGTTHLAAGRHEPDEVAGLREQVAALHHVMQARVDNEQRWIGSAVHDVKAGLVGLAHLLDAAEAQRNANGCEAELLTTARVEAKRLVEVLTRLTDLVRFSQLEMVERREVDLDALLREIVARHLGPHHRARVSLQLEPNAAARDRPAVVMGDNVLLDRAFSNVLDNAIRVARSRVKVSVYPNLVRIEDDGPGLKHDVTTLSQPFRSETVSINGLFVPGGNLGLGLFIARRVLEAHDGRLTVERTSSEGTAMLAYVGSAS